MALSDIIASFTPNGSVALPFAVFVGGDGITIDTPETLQERLTTPGVDYARWRDIHKQFPPNTFMTWAECFSTMDYQNRARRYRDASGTFGTLLRVFRGTPTTWKNVHLDAVKVLQPIPSGIFGFGSGGGQLTIAAMMTFSLTETTQ